MGVDAVNLLFQLGCSSKDAHLPSIELLLELRPLAVAKGGASAFEHGDPLIQLVDLGIDQLLADGLDDPHLHLILLQ